MRFTKEQIEKYLYGEGMKITEEFKNYLSSLLKKINGENK